MNLRDPVSNALNDGEGGGPNEMVLTSFVLNQDMSVKTWCISYITK